MIRIAKSLCCCAVLLVTHVSLAFAESSSNDAARFLCVNGTNLCDHQGGGAVVQLHGVNLGGWLEWQAWMCPMAASTQLRDVNPGHNGYDFEVRKVLEKRFGVATADKLIETYEDAWITGTDLDNIKALKMNAVRLTLAYDTLMKDDGSWRDDAFKKIDWLVSNAWDRRIYTIIDYHAFLPPGANGSATGYFADAAQQRQTVKIWTRLAEHFRGNPAVAMYDLLNEPNNSSPKGKSPPKSETVCALYDKIYTAIRSVDRKHVIAMEGMWDWTTLRDPRKAGYENVVCSLHFYHFGSDKTRAENNAATDRDMAGVKKMQEQWHIPANIGEFNLFGDPVAWTYALRAYQQAGVSWTEWAYKNRVEGDNSWGVFTVIPGKSPPIPDLAKDTAEMIRDRWQAWATDRGAFAINPMLGPVLQEDAKAR